MRLVTENIAQLLPLLCNGVIQLHISTWPGLSSTPTFFGAQVTYKLQWLWKYAVLQRHRYLANPSGLAIASESGCENHGRNGGGGHSGRKNGGKSV
jgi:hypothetical protein